jgi:excisionase family DNA binding protein
VNEQPFLTVKQVAEKLRIPVSSVQRYIRKKKLAAHRVGRIYRISPADLEQYLQRNRTIQQDEENLPLAG